MDYVLIIIIVVVVAVLIFSSYSRGKHTPREIKPKGHENDPDYKGMELRAMEDQVRDLIEEQRAQGWALESKEMKPDTAMFGSDIWRLTFRKMTMEELRARDAEDARRKSAGPPVSVPPPLPAEQAPQTPAEDPFATDVPAPEAPAEDPFAADIPVPQASGEDPFAADIPVPQASAEDPFAADIPLPQLPAAGETLSQAPDEESALSQAPEEDASRVPAEGREDTEPTEGEQ